MDEKSAPRNEPQDVAEVGPTPYEYLFAETIEKNKDFLAEVKRAVEE